MKHIDNAKCKNINISTINIFVSLEGYTAKTESVKEQKKQAEPMRNMKAKYVIDGKLLSENIIEWHILWTFTYCVFTYLCK